MAKAAGATSTRLRLHFDVPVEEVGHWLTELTGRGAANVGYEVISDIWQFRRNNNAMTSAVATEMLGEFAKASPDGFGAREFCDHVVKAGGSRSLAYKTLHQALNAKTLVRRGTGPGARYGAAPLMITGPKKPLREAQRARNSVRYKVSNKDLMLKFMRGRKTFKVSDLIGLFRKERRPSGSATALLTKLAKRKLVKRIGEGLYQVLKADALKEKKPKISPTTPAPTPSSVHERREDVNG